MEGVETKGMNVVFIFFLFLTTTFSPLVINISYYFISFFHKLKFIFKYKFFVLFFYKEFKMNFLIQIIKMTYCIYKIILLNLTNTYIYIYIFKIGVNTYRISGWSNLFRPNNQLYVLIQSVSPLIFYVPNIRKILDFDWISDSIYKNKNILENKLK